MKRKTAKEVLAESFREIAEKKPVDKITVPEIAEYSGYSFEKVVLEAEKAGLGTTWIAGTMDRPAFEKAMDLADDEVMPCISPLGYPAKKMSVREMMMRKGVKADSRLPFEELFFADDMSPEIHDLLEMVRLAPSAVNKQPWRVVIHGNTAHFYEKKSKGFINEAGWDLQKVDMGIAMYHFVYGAMEYGYDTEFVTEDPHIAVFGNTEYIASCIFG